MYHGTDDLNAARDIYFHNTWEFIGKNTPGGNRKGIWLTPDLEYAKTMAKDAGAIIIMSISPELMPKLIREGDNRYVREIPGADPNKPHVVEGLVPIGVLNADGRYRIEQCLR
jgi:hypothetical protein